MRNLRSCDTRSSRKSSGWDWNDLLYDRLRDSSRPVFLFDDVTVPAASLWTGSRLWVNAFREEGLEAGDRLLLHLPPGPAFIQVLIASFWDDLSLVVVDPNEDIDDHHSKFRSLDVRAGVSRQDHPHCWTSDRLSGPESEPAELRESTQRQTESVRFFLRTSGTTGQPGWYGISDRNLRTVLESHRRVLDTPDSALSHLPWHHSFELILGVLRYILEGTIVHRVNSNADIASSMIEVIHDINPDTLNTVPVMTERVSRKANPEIFSKFDEGIVGGAPINDEHCSILRGTNFRVGYGQTEASPGISLGQQGFFEPGLLGRPVGCDLSVTDDSELIFTGANAHEMRLDRSREALVDLDVPRSVSTGDLVEKRNGNYYFMGRKNHTRKLPNGTFVNLRNLEQQIQTEFNSVDSIVLFQEQTGKLLAAVVLADTRTSVPDDLRRRIPYLETIQTINERDVSRTSKGSIDRDRTRSKLSVSK